MGLIPRTSRLCPKYGGYFSGGRGGQKQDRAVKQKVPAIVDQAMARRESRSFIKRFKAKMTLSALYEARMLAEPGSRFRCASESDFAVEAGTGKGDAREPTTPLGLRSQGSGQPPVVVRDRWWRQGATTDSPGEPPVPGRSPASGRTLTMSAGKIEWAQQPTRRDCGDSSFVRHLAENHHV